MSQQAAADAVDKYVEQLVNRKLAEYFMEQADLSEGEAERRVDEFVRTHKQEIVDDDDADSDAEQDEPPKKGKKKVKETKIEFDNPGTSDEDETDDEDEATTKKKKGEKKKTTKNDVNDVLITLEITVYVEALTEEEGNRKSATVSPLGKVIYAAGKLNVNIRQSVAKKFPEWVYFGTPKFARVNQILVNNPDDTEKKVKTMYDRTSNLAGYRFMLKPRVDGPPPPDDYLRKKKLKNDVVGQVIAFEYLKCSRAFIADPRDVYRSNYIKRKFRANSCLASIIIDTFKSSYERVTGKELTYKSLWKICRPVDPLPPDGVYALSLEDAVRFFQRVRLSLVAVDIYCNVVVHYRPADDGKKRNTNFADGTTLRVLAHQGHAYKLDHRLPRFDCLVQKFERKKYRLEPPRNMFIREQFNYTEDCVIPEPKKVISFVADYTGDAKRLRVVCDYDMNCLVAEFKERGMVATQLQTKNDCILGFEVRKADTTFSISRLYVREEDADRPVQSKDEHVAFMEQYKKLYRAIINTVHLSVYHPQFAEVMRTYFRRPLVGKFYDDGAPDFSLYHYVDMIKAYTSNVLALKRVPKVNKFCWFVPFDGEPMDDNNFYLVRKDDATGKDLLLFDRKYVLISGLTLRMTKAKCTVLYYCAPRESVPNKIIPAAVRELWKSDVSIDEKKFLMNMCIGWSDKGRNKSERCEFFDDLQEALLHKKNSPLMRIQSVSTKHGGEEKTYFLLIHTAQSLLEDGFLPFSFVKYDMQRLRLWQMYTRLEEAGFRVVGVKTDALFVDRDIRPFVDANPDLFPESTDAFESIGKWKAGVDGVCPRCLLEQEQNQLDVTDVPIPKQTTVTPKYEKNWKDKKFKKKFIEGALAILAEKNILIRSKYPGCGKSYLMVQFLKDKMNKHVIVCPNWLQCIKYLLMGFNATTLNALCGVGIDGRRVGQPKNVKGIEFVAFDEIYQHSCENKQYIWEFMQEHPEMRFIATGDPNQIGPYDDESAAHRAASPTLSTDDVVSFLFPDSMELNVMKRFRPCERQVFSEVFADLFEREMNVIDVIRKHEQKFGGTVTSLAEVQTQFNLSYTNSTRQRVNWHVFKEVLGRRKVGQGQKMALKAYRKNMIRNYEYTVDSISDEEVVVRDEEKKKHTLSRESFNEDFDLPYSWTCHTFQGMDVDQAYTVFEAEKADRRWFWTALTRATSLKNVFFYLGPDLSVPTKVVRKKLEKDIARHRATDKEKEVYDEEHFVTVEWALNEIKNRCRWTCPNCQCPLGCEAFKHSSNFSIHRNDNTLGHTKTNCRVVCWGCNNSLK